MRIITPLLALSFVTVACTPVSAAWPDDVWAQAEAARQRAEIVHRAHVRPRQHRAPAVKAWRVPAPGPLHAAPACQAAFRTVGDQAITIAGAKEAAEKAFSQQARFSWGERFADVTNARDTTYECVRSSIGSVAGQTFHRCEIRARPCMAPQVGKD